MSLLGSLFKVAAPIVGGFLGGPVGAAIGTGVAGLIGGQPAPMPMPAPAQFAVGGFRPPQLSLNGAPAVPVRQPLPPGVIANITGPLAARPGDACPVGYHLDKKTKSKCVRNRRMNVLNPRAASRSIRRVRGARKMLQRIERQLPKAKARTAPQRKHHHHVVEH